MRVMKKKKNNYTKGKYKYGFSVPDDYVYRAKKGLTAETVNVISEMKGEPLWMTAKRHQGYEIFLKKPMPIWGADLSKIDFENIYYYIKPTQRTEKSWDDVPEGIKTTYDRLGIPEAEKEYLGGVKAQYESEVVYGSLIKRLQIKGLYFVEWTKH